jgi:hypothetical protein
MPSSSGLKQYKKKHFGVSGNTVNLKLGSKANSEPVTIDRNNQVLLWTATPLKMKAQRSFEAPGSTVPKTHCHIPVEMCALIGSRL